MNIYEKNMLTKSNKELMGIINSQDNTVIIEAVETAKKEIEKRKLSGDFNEEENVEDENLENGNSSHTSQRKFFTSKSSSMKEDIKIIRQWVTFFGVTYVLGLMISILTVVHLISK